MRSLRARLMLGIVATTTTTFLLAAMAIYLLARSSLVSEFDAATLAKAGAVAAAVELDKGELLFEESATAQLTEFLRADRPEYFQVVTAERKILARSQSLGERDLGNQQGSALLPDGRKGRQVTASFPVRIEDDVTGAAPRVTITVARETRDLDEKLNRFALLLLLVGAAATGVMLGLSALVIRRGLAPVDRLAGSIARIGERNLSARLSDAEIPAELTPIVSRLNDLLARLNSAFDREKSFTADAAHELRTPLAGLEAALGVCAKKARAPEAYAVVVNDCLGVVRGMHGMIDNLLLLARADAQQIRLETSAVHIGDLIEESWRRVESIATDRAIKVEWEIEPDLTVQTDREKLLHVLNNLFDNAVRYADQGGRIRTSAKREGTHAHIAIANTGSRVSAEDAPRVLERFWRADPARSDAGAHAGLGLSVCQKMLAALSGEIRITSSDGGEFIAEIIL